MLSLVAYQSSEESESEAEETASNSATGKKSENETEETASNSAIGKKSENETEQTASAIPNKHDGENDSCELKNSNSCLPFAIPSKTKETVKITVPSLKEFEDDDKDEPSIKKIRKSTGCGLISMLPPPKYSKPASSQKPFMPYVLTKKHSPSSAPTDSSVSNSSSTELPKKATSCIRSSVKTEFDFENEVSDAGKDDHSSVMDFFSLKEPIRHKPESNFSVPLNNAVLKCQEKTSEMTGNFLQANTVSQTSLILPKNCIAPLQSQPKNDGLQFSESEFNKNFTAEPAWENQLAGSSPSYAAYPEAVASAKEYTADERFLRLQGKRKGQEEINIIDVSVDDQLSDKTVWLTKSLTEEKVHRPSRKKNDMPTQLQKRKHQITYLAFQAKERELELKNQWSQNKLTKRETQAKYGF